MHTHTYTHTPHTLPYTPHTLLHIPYTHTFLHIHHTHTHITHLHTHTANHYLIFLEGNNHAIHRCDSKPVRNSIKLDWIKLQKAQAIPIFWINCSLSEHFKFSLSPSFCLCPGPTCHGVALVVEPRLSVCWGFSLWSCTSLSCWHLQGHSATCCEQCHSDWGKAAKYCGTPLFFKTQGKLQLINIY